MVASRSSTRYILPQIGPTRANSSLNKSRISHEPVGRRHARSAQSVRPHLALAGQSRTQELIFQSYGYNTRTVIDNVTCSEGTSGGDCNSGCNDTDSGHWSLDALSGLYTQGCLGLVWTHESVRRVSIIDGLRHTRQGPSYVRLHSYASYSTYKARSRSNITFASRVLVSLGCRFTMPRRKARCHFSPCSESPSTLRNACQL